MNPNKPAEADVHWFCNFRWQSGYDEVFIRQIHSLTRWNWVFFKRSTSPNCLPSRTIDSLLFSLRSSTYLHIWLNSMYTCANRYNNLSKPDDDSCCTHFYGTSYLHSLLYAEKPVLHSKVRTHHLTKVSETEVVKGVKWLFLKNRRELQPGVTPDL